MKRPIPHWLRQMIRLQNWAKAAGFGVILFAALACTFEWAISYPSAVTVRKFIAQSEAQAKAPSLQHDLNPEHERIVDGGEIDRLQKAANDRGLTVGTWALVVVTTLLVLAALGQILVFIWQLRLIGYSVDDTRKSANAAVEAAEATKVSADAASKDLLLSHPPKIVIRRCKITTHNSIDCFHVNDVDENNLICGSFDIINIGRNTARISGVFTRFIASNSGLPMLFPYDNQREDKTCFEITPAWSFEYKIPQHKPHYLNQNPILTDGWVLYLVGWVDCTKMNGDPVSRTYFCRKWDANTRRFLRVNDQDYDSED